MMRIRVKKLIWTQWNQEHIQKHNVTIVQVETAAKNLIAHKRGYTGRYIILGRVETRILAIIVVRERKGEYLVVTARDADKKERRRVYEKEKDR